MSKSIIIRKKEQVVELMTEREQAYALRQKELNESWFKHWDRPKDSNTDKRLGGGRRPRYFCTDSLDFEASSDIR